MTGNPPSCVSSLVAWLSTRASGGGIVRDRLPSGYVMLACAEGRVQVAFAPRAPGSPTVGSPPDPPPPTVLVLGDDFELGDSPLDRATGNATVVRVDFERRSIEAQLSIPGLPALYVAETPSGVCLTSDPHLLSCVQGLQLRFDRDGVTDLAVVGRPVGWRTLFADVRMIPAGSRVLARDGRVSVREGWTPPQREPCRTWHEYTELQADTFAEAIDRLRTRTCALSLSSGLDSRATLAGLIQKGASFSALTVSGENQCLDARTAERLCRAYGLEHLTIRLGDDFRRDLPELSEQASLLSGGISSVWHVAQVYCYRVLGEPPPHNALSGYLGNQVGRRGTEGLTPREAELDILSPELRVRRSEPATSWYEHAMQADGHLETAFLIQQESTFGNLASYQVGNSHSVQQSPYAYRPLIENMWRMPAAPPDRPGRGAHSQTLRHRFFGEPLEESFQRKFINRVGGLVSTFPVNWGWRASGGVSLVGLWWGGLTLLDAVVASRYPERWPAKVTEAFGIRGLHEFRPVHEWMFRHMRDFVTDELLATPVRDSGLFDSAALRRVLDGYYSTGRGFREVALALDLALAARNFRATT